MFQRDECGPGLKTKQYAAAATSDADLKAVGGMGRGAREIACTTAGTLSVVNEADGSEEDLALTTELPLSGFFIRIAWGTRASRNSAAGTFPGVLVGGETLVLRFDSGTVLDTSNVTVTFLITDTTQALAIARINARLNLLFPEPGGHPDRVWASDQGGGVTRITGRARGSAAAAAVISQSAAIGTMLGFSVGSTAGAQHASPASGLTVTW